MELGRRCLDDIRDSHIAREANLPVRPVRIDRTCIEYVA